MKYCAAQAFAIAASLLAPGAVAATAGTFSNFNSTCASTASKISLPNVTINFATFVPAGTNLTLSQAGGLDTCDRPFQVVPVDICRIAMRVVTSKRSEITLEAWFPSNWTGRFLSTGNGGISGCIQYEDMAYTVGMGFATVGANNGHNGTSGLSWYHNEDVVADFSYRSMHTGVVVGKQLIPSFYGSNYTKSYYLGCSTGGRQGFKAVQDFPEDFDGLVIGAPAVAFNNLTSWSGHFFTIIGSNTSATYLAPELWVTVHQMVLDQCDALDGVVDGIIEDPLLCYPRPEALLCAKGNTTNCLTSAQVESVRQLYSDWYGEDGAMIYPRFNPGNELVASEIFYTGESFSYSNDWFRYAIFQNPNWDPSTLSIADAAYAAWLDPAKIQTFNGDISAFKNTGGKILHYHGQQDSIISSDISPIYYNTVSREMEMPTSELDSFYRFFRIGGMDHCSGGAGAWKIGQTSQGAAGNSLTAQDNVLLRMVAWVEGGDSDAPSTVTGVKYVNDTVADGVDFVRNHCKFPLRNTCVDPGNYKSAGAWKCV